MGNGQNNSDVASPPQEKKYGHLIEQQVQDALIAAGAELRNAKSTEDERRRDQERKVDILITAVPGLPYPERVIALQVTMDLRIGRKLPKFMYESNTVADRKVYLRIRDPRNTTFDRTLGNTLLTAIRAWLLNVGSSAHRAVCITLFRDLTFTLSDLADLVSEHAARVAATEGEQLVGTVKSFLPGREFGFVDCDDQRLVDGNEEQGDFQFYFHASDCSPEVAERLKNGEESIKVFFRNDGYDHNRASDEAPRARKLVTYVPPAKSEPDSGPPPDPEALRAWMQGVYDALGLATHVTPPPELAPEQWRALREFGYYPLRLPTLGPDDPLPTGFPNIEKWPRGPIVGRWIAIETIKANPHRHVAHTSAEVNELIRAGYRPQYTHESDERYADDRVAKAIQLEQRLGIRPDDLYGIYLRRVANLIGSHVQKVRLPSAEEWLFIAGLLNVIRERDREDLPNLLEPCVYELVANIDSAIPAFKSAIGGSTRNPVDFTRLMSYDSSPNVGFRTLIELE